MNVPDDVLAVLSAAQTTGNRLMLIGQLERKLYERTNKVLAAAGGTWNRKAKAHIFETDPADVIDQVLLTGAIDTPQEFGYFPSPPGVVRELVRRARLAPGMRVLEPSAGQGAIAEVLAETCRVDCVEILPKNVSFLRVKQGRRTEGPVCGFGRVQEADFLTLEPEPAYDRVVMNPPFARQADVHHVLHALRFLKPDGLLSSVMSTGVRFREDRRARDFRELVARLGGAIEALPDDSFKTVGTNVRTVVVTLPANKEG